jgi:hypothetical protein
MDADDTSALRVLVRLVARHAYERDNPVHPLGGAGESADTDDGRGGSGIGSGGGGDRPVDVTCHGSTYAQAAALEHHMDVFDSDAKKAVKRVAKAVGTW